MVHVSMLFSKSYTEYAKPSNNRCIYQCVRVRACKHRRSFSEIAILQNARIFMPDASAHVRTRQLWPRVWWNLTNYWSLDQVRGYTNAGGWMSNQSRTGLNASNKGKKPPSRPLYLRNSSFCKRNASLSFPQFPWNTREAPQWWNCKYLRFITQVCCSGSPFAEYARALKYLTGAYISKCEKVSLNQLWPDECNEIWANRLLSTHSGGWNVCQSTTGLNASKDGKKTSSWPPDLRNSSFCKRNSSRAWIRAACGPMFSHVSRPPTTMQNPAAANHTIDTPIATGARGQQFTMSTFFGGATLVLSQGFSLHSNASKLGGRNS